MLNTDNWDKLEMLSKQFYEWLTYPAIWMLVFTHVEFCTKQTYRAID